MATLFQILNLLVLLIGLSGLIFLIYAAWRVLKSTKLNDWRIRNTEFCERLPEPVIFEIFNNYRHSCVLISSQLNHEMFGQTNTKPVV